MDDFDEEETLEGAADLGTMIREMSIDQITRPGDDREEDRRRSRRRRLRPRVTSMRVEEEDEEEDRSRSTQTTPAVEDDFNRDAGLATGRSKPRTNGQPLRRESSYNTDRRPRRDSGRRDGRRGGRDRAATAPATPVAAETANARPS